MPRTKATIKRPTPALRSAPISGAGVARKSKNTMSSSTTIFRLLKVPKYAKRTLAGMCEHKSKELEEEVGRLRESWMEKEREMEWLRRELGRVQGELRAVKEDGGCRAAAQGGPELTEMEKRDLESLWDWYGQ